MDQFSAHLDRGWDLAQRGDASGAELSARRALEMDGQSPEAHNLLGYVSALQGNFEEAIDHYTQAIALDDTYFEAMLNAAEIYIHPLGDYSQAIELCDQAVDLAENDDERVDAMLLKFDALLGANQLDQARELCRKFPSGPFENPNHTLLVGRACYETGDLGRAGELIEQATQTGADNPEGWYYLGLIRDERGDARGATEAFLRSRDLELALPSVPWTLTPETFAHTVQQAIAGLDEQYRSYLRTEEVFVSDVPGVEVVADGVDPRALVLLDGIADSTDDANATARVFVYQRNVERLAGSVETIETELKNALEREIIATFVDPEREPGTTNVLN
jgi:Flp pilus assembly protein TadD